MFSTRNILFLCLMLYACTMNAQWRVGVTAGADYNSFTSDDHYLTDFHTKGRWGKTFGIVGQYDIKEWQFLHSKIGARAELTLTDKNYLTVKEGYTGNTKIFNDRCYLQIPIMATYSLGGEHLKAFINAGGYGGWLLKKYEWERTFELGGVGGIGVEWNFFLSFCKKRQLFTLQTEARCYVGALSVTKSDRKFKTPHYNTTAAIMMTLLYNF